MRRTPIEGDDPPRMQGLRALPLSRVFLVNVPTRPVVHWRAAEVTTFALAMVALQIGTSCLFLALTYKVRPAPLSTVRASGVASDARSDTRGE